MNILSEYWRKRSNKVAKLKILFFADFGHLNTASNQSSSREIEELSFNISNLIIFRPSTIYQKGSILKPRIVSIKFGWAAAKTKLSKP